VNTEQANQLLRACLHEVAPEKDLSTVPADADLAETLRLDSLDFLQVVELLSQRGGIRIDEEDYPRLATLASAAELIVDRSARSATP
jgi:acyl carrier protein